MSSEEWLGGDPTWGDERSKQAERERTRVIEGDLIIGGADDEEVGPLQDLSNYITDEEDNNKDGRQIIYKDRHKHKKVKTVAYIL